MMRMIMRSGTAVNILMQKRVRFICVHGIMIRRLDGLFHEILLPVRKLIHSVLTFMQKAHYEAWIKLHSDWEYAGVFYDFGITGTKADVRDGLQALVYECRIGRIDYVLTKSVSRFSRNTTDCLALVRELLSYKVPIYFEKKNTLTAKVP